MDKVTKWVVTCIFKSLNCAVSDKTNQMKTFKNIYFNFMFPVLNQGHYGPQTVTNCQTLEEEDDAWNLCKHTKFYNTITIP